MLRGLQNLLEYNAEENNPARSKSLNFLINSDMRGRLSHVELINTQTMRNFIGSCFEKLTQSGFIEVTKLNIYSLLALLKVK